MGRLVEYRGVEVISAYGPVEVAGLRWAIAAKQDVAEALAPAFRLKRELLVTAAVAAIALTFLALACVGLFMRPLRRVDAGIKTVSGGAVDSSIKLPGRHEVTSLARGASCTADRIQDTDKML